LSQPAQLHVPNKLPPYDLASILAPLDADEFLVSTYGQNFRHVTGTPNKFCQLLPWPVLNRILEEHRLDPPRLRLTREGKPVPVEKYLGYQTNRRKNAKPIPRINATGLTRELREGATLVLDAVDELHRPIRGLAESLERAFHVRVQVNAYAGWRTSHGFDLHWDDHDVFVLQVAGRKQWKVYGMTRKHPLGRDAEPTLDPPTEVLWEGLLNSGDLLYIPRGWWHVATPLDEPTLHLTVGANNLTGADFITWFADRLRAVEDVRRDIPLFGNAPAARRAFANRLRDALVKEWRPDLIDEFLDEMDAKTRPRPHLGLPWTATEKLLPAGGWRVKWTGSRDVRLQSTVPGEIAIHTNGRRWKFSETARALLTVLTSGHECSVDDLLAIDETIDPQTVHAFVKELVAEGLLIVV